MRVARRCFSYRNLSPTLGPLRRPIPTYPTTPDGPCYSASFTVRCAKFFRHVLKPSPHFRKPKLSLSKAHFTQVVRNRGHDYHDRFITLCRGCTTVPTRCDSPVHWILTTRRFPSKALTTDDGVGQPHLLHLMRFNAGHDER